MDRFKGDGSEGSAFDDSMFDLWLECVRQGRADFIRSRYGESEKRAVCERFFMGDRAYALRVCMVLWVEAVKIAEKVGVPNTLVDAGFERCIHRSQDAGTPWRLVELSEDYLADLARIIGENTYVGEASPVFVKFQRYVRSHIYEPLALEDIAEALCISKSHLSHTIKKETGETVHKWILKEKIGMAKLMLSRKSYCMNEIWDPLGFCSQSHFAKCFRQITGMTPSQFRTETKFLF